MIRLTAVTAVTQTSHFEQACFGAFGDAKLRTHLGAAIAFMKLSRDYFDFIDKMDIQATLLDGDDEEAAN